MINLIGSDKPFQNIVVQINYNERDKHLLKRNLEDNWEYCGEIIKFEKNKYSESYLVQEIMGSISLFPVDFNTMVVSNDDLSKLNIFGKSK